MNHNVETCGYTQARADIIATHRRARLFVHASDRRAGGGAFPDLVGRSYEGWARACAALREIREETIASAPDADWRNWVWEACLEPPEGGNRGNTPLLPLPFDRQPYDRAGQTDAYVCFAGDQAWLTGHGPARVGLAEAEMRDRFPEWLRLHGDPESLFWIDVDCGAVHECVLAASL